MPTIVDILTFMRGMNDWLWWLNSENMIGLDNFDVYVCEQF